MCSFCFLMITSVRAVACSWLQGIAAVYMYLCHIMFYRGFCISYKVRLHVSFIGFCLQISLFTSVWFTSSDFMELLTLTLPGPSAGVSGSLDSYCSLKPLCSGMGEVVPARTSPTLLPPSPRTVLSLSCSKVSQCINCRDWHFKG